jgi:hypothetical protein
MPSRSRQNLGCELDASVGHQITQNDTESDHKGNGSEGYSDLNKQVGDQRPSAIYDDIGKYRWLLRRKLCHGQ